MSDHADEVVLDSPATGAEGAPQPSEPLCAAGENRPPPDAGELEEVAGDDVVAAPEQADADRGENDRRRREAVGAEAVAGADRKDERDHRDEDQRAHDTPEPASPLAF